MALYLPSTLSICSRCLHRLSLPSKASNASFGLSRATFSTASHPPIIPSSPRTSNVKPKAHGPHKHIRSYASAASAADSLPATGITQLSHRSLIRVQGTDAPKFLQGLISNNLEPTATTPFYTAFMDARGRMMCDAFIYPDPNPESPEWSCFVEVDGTQADNLLKHLKRHKLRSKIQLQIIDQEAGGVWASWDTGDMKRMPGGLPDPRTQGFGQRILLSGESSKSSVFREILDNYQVDSKWYHLRRYMYGIAEGPMEILPGSALPMESNIDLMNGIDFRKGCYVGQELTIRTKHTGVVRKRILPVQLYHGDETIPDSSEMPTFDPEWSLSEPLRGLGEDANTPEGDHQDESSPNQDIKRLSDNGTVKKGRAAGKLLATIGNVGLALCRLEMMTDLRVSAEGGSWKPGIEFGAQVGGGIRVKAVVPAWLRAREQQMWTKP